MEKPAFAAYMRNILVMQENMSLLACLDLKIAVYLRDSIIIYNYIIIIK